MESLLSLTSVSAMVSCVTLVTSFHLSGPLVTRLESEVLVTPTATGVPEQLHSRTHLTTHGLGFSSSREKPLRGTAPASTGAALAVRGEWLEKSCSSRGGVGIQARAQLEGWGGALGHLSPSPCHVQGPALWPTSSAVLGLSRSLFTQGGMARGLHRPFGDLFPKGSNWGLPAWGLRL